VEPDAAGSVDLKQNKQGKANIQRLTLTLKGLTPDTTYTLHALIGDSIEFTPVAEFATESNGSTTLRYEAKSVGNKNGVGNGNSNGNGKGKGKGKGKKAPLPAGTDPVSSMTGLAVLDSTGQSVLTADLTAPDHLQYLVKRSLVGDGVSAMLHIKATGSKTSLHLSASGLVPSSDYSLVLNGGIAETHTSDAKGKLSIKTSLQDAMDVLHLQTVELWDAANTPVIGTTLP
jgi:hypothetical protein